MNLSLPGKVFLLGEYSVLTGGRAILAAVGTRFQWTSSTYCPKFHPKSPAGKWLEANNRDLTGEFHDPHEGRGGFGASTAQFAFGFFSRDPSQLPLDAWRAYRALHKTDTTAPSGADLLTQLEGGICVADYSLGDPSVRKLRQATLQDQLLVFTATHLEGRKVATHEHLREAKWRSEWTAEAISIVNRAEEAHIEDSPQEFGDALNQYADFLARHGLESVASAEDRKVLSSIRGVLGCKGTGALLSDVVIVLVDDLSSASLVVAAAEKRGLRLALQGIKQERGITAHE